MQESADPCTRLSCNSHFQEETAVEPVDALSPLTIRGRSRSRTAPKRAPAIRIGHCGLECPFARPAGRDIVE